jgi:hypothetical protein
MVLQTFKVIRLIRRGSEEGVKGKVLRRGAGRNAWHETCLGGRAFGTYGSSIGKGSENRRFSD